MATQSILKNITITDLTDAEAFISAVEKAVQTAETSSPHIVESEDLSGEELKRFWGKMR